MTEIRVLGDGKEGSDERVVTILSVVLFEAVNVLARQQTHSAAQLAHELAVQDGHLIIPHRLPPTTVGTPTPGG